MDAGPGLENGARAMAYLLDHRPEVDAVFFAGDLLAGGALLECNRRGVEVPGQMAIAAYDDYDLAVALSPSLTALRIPRYEIGRSVAETLLLRLDGKALSGKTVDLGFEVLHRQST